MTTLTTYTRKTTRNHRPVLLAVAAASAAEAECILGLKPDARSINVTPAVEAATKLSPGRVFWSLRICAGVSQKEADAWHPIETPVPDKPPSEHKRRQRAMEAEMLAAQSARREASIFHVNAGGIGSIPPTAEVHVDRVTLTSKLGARIEITWSEGAGGFSIRTIETESTDGVRRDAHVAVRPMSSNVVVIVPTCFDHNGSQRRAARGER